MAVLTDPERSIIGAWSGEPGRKGVQFESVTFGEDGQVDAHIVTLCVRGFCPSVQATGTYVVGNGTVEIALDGIPQQFRHHLEGNTLELREPTGGHSKRYFRAER